MQTAPTIKVEQEKQRPTKEELEFELDLRKVEALEKIAKHLENLDLLFKGLTFRDSTGASYVRLFNEHV